MQNLPRRTQRGITFLAGLYALIFVLLLIASVGDKERFLNAQAWFSWHVVYLVVVVADAPSLAPPTPAYYTLIRIAMSVGAALQALGFMIWSIVLWAGEPQTSGSPLDRPANFFGLMIASFATLFICGLAMVWVLMHYYFSVHHAE